MVKKQQEFRAASMPFQLATYRVLGEVGAVIFWNHKLDRTDAPQSLGRAWTLEWHPVIQIREGLDLLMQVRVLIHEWGHHLFDGVPNYKRTSKGVVKTWGTCIPFRKGEENRVQAFEDETMEKVMARLDEKRKTTERPPGWWEGKYVESFAIHPGMIDKRVAEILDLVVDVLK